MRSLLVLPVLFLAASCAHEKAATPVADPVVKAAPAPEAKATSATLKAAPKGKVSGMIKFTPEGNQLHVVAEVKGLKPNSKHGFHVHENGECTPPKFETAGSHYNPSGVQHGEPGNEHRHPGDLGNLQADKKGVARLDMMIPQSPSNDSFAGRAVIVHEKMDDGSQPVGNAGGRIACGVLSAE